MASANYLRNAKSLYSQHQYPASFAFFVKYFQSLEDPTESSPIVQNTFIDLVCKIGMVLEEIGDTEELLKIYLQAVDFFPDNYVILSNFGCYMYKICELDVAKTYLEMAVELNEEYLPAKKNLMHCKWQQIPRWHFKMLNDKKRNLAYQTAILNVIDKGFTNIIDIGAGCGLLSLIAAQKSNVKIMAFEENKLLSTMMQSILKNNNIECVTVLNCHSSDITQSPVQCNCIVTETFDIALFGEHMLESLIHAHDVLITEKPFKIVPQKAQLFVKGINYKDPQCYKYVNNIPELNLINGICIRQLNPEPYEGEDVTLKTYETLTNTQAVFNINFSDIQQLKNMLDENFNEIIKLKAIKEGEINALLCWFDLRLDENTTITTNPLDDNRIDCWEQAVFFLPHSISLKKHEDVSFKATIAESMLKFDPVDSLNKCRKCWLMSKEIISFLNDASLVSFIKDVANKIKSSAALNITILDFNTFPLFGLLMAKDGFTSFVLKHDSDSNYVNFLKHIIDINHIQHNKIIRALDSEFKLESLTKSHFYFSLPIDTDGSLKNTNQFGENGKRIPETLRLKFQLIYSSYIDTSNIIKDDNVFNFKIAKSINEYTGGEHPNIENLQYQSFSEPLSQEINGNDVDEKIEVSVTKTGHINAVYTWFEFSYDDLIFSTLDSYHYKKCAYILDTKSVETGNIVKLHLRIQKPYIDFKLI